MKLILASSSKQRREILNNLGLKYEVVKSLVEESSLNTDPCEYVKDLSISLNLYAEKLEGKED